MAFTGSIRQWLLTERLLPFWRPLRHQRGVIFTWHRFAPTQDGTGACAVPVLREQLELLRRARFDVIPLPEFVTRARDGDPRLGRSVALTVDDGYEDFHSVGAPVFADYDCPVTTFLVSDFLDGKDWLWWDKVDWAIREAPAAHLSLAVGAVAFNLRWENEPERRACLHRAWQALKEVPDSVRHSAIDAMTASLGLTVPQQCPREFAPMTWEQVRGLEARGFSFGPHTVSHPILSRCDDATAAMEIEGSWRRVEAELERALPVFAYPNGTPDDFTERELSLLSRAGISAAVTMTQDYVRPLAARDPSAAYRLPRFSAAEDRWAYHARSTGMERMLRLLRSLRP